MGHGHVPSRVDAPADPHGSTQGHVVGDVVFSLLKLGEPIWSHTRLGTRPCDYLCAILATKKSSRNLQKWHTCLCRSSRAMCVTMWFVEVL